MIFWQEPYSNYVFLMILLLWSVILKKYDFEEYDFEKNFNEINSLTQWFK